MSNDPVRHLLVANLLARCHEVFATNPGDIPSWCNTVQTYLVPDNQHKYIDMYFAKYVGAWRRIRRHLGAPSDCSLVLSIGAGPCLCLIGWFWDKPPEPHQNIVGLDLVTWDHVRALPEFNALTTEVFRGAQAFNYYSPWFFPSTMPPQASLPELVGAATIEPTAIPEGATVLLPMVLNHLIGANAPHSRPEHVFSWLRGVCLRSRRVIVLDMPESKTPAFWATFWRGLGFPPQASARTFDFSTETQEFSADYPENEGPRRTGIRYPHARFCELSAAMFDQITGRWTYF